MKDMVVNNVKYRVHSINLNFAAAKSGRIINVKRRKPMDGHFSTTSNTCYMLQKI